jgi:hypothetical protein
MKKKGIPLFLSGALVKELERTMLWRMDYKKDYQAATSVKTLANYLYEQYGKKN